jgi:hypothetical protein
MLLAGRRGATAVTFALAAIALTSLVGLGADAGNWYVGQNVVNAAAAETALATPGECTGTVCTPLQGLVHPIPGVSPFTATYDPSRNTVLSFSTLPCVTNGMGNITVSGNEVSWTTTSPISPSWSSSSGKAYCGGNGGATLTVDSSHTPLSFSPGTYVFSNISLKFTGGVINCPTCTCPPVASATTCSWVTIILTGTSAAKIGTLTTTPGANVTVKLRMR